MFYILLVNLFYLFTLSLSLPHSPIVSSISITIGVSNDDDESLGSTIVLELSEPSPQQLQVHHLLMYT